VTPPAHAHPTAWPADLVAELEQIAVTAGHAILAVYERPGDAAVMLKDDRSPLTEAGGG
jgi:3'-phosphoadenosine 5'-phosphosulfate (PAPS) 3'-phosphatase